MTRSQRNRLKLFLTLGCLAWVGAAAYFVFGAIPDDAIQHHKSEAVKEKMKECEGSFQQRYDCKEAIVIKSGRDTFWNLTTRLLFVVVPAFAGGIVGSMLIRRIPIDKPPPPPEDKDWKQRAQAHISQANPPSPGGDHHSSGPA